MSHSVSNGTPVEKRKCWLLSEGDKQKGGAVGAKGSDLQKNERQPVPATSPKVDMETGGRVVFRRN